MPTGRCRKSLGSGGLVIGYHSVLNPPGPSRGLLRDCENRLWNRLIDLQHYDQGCCARACCNVRLSVHLYDAEADSSTNTSDEVQQLGGEEGDQEEDWRVCIVQGLTSLANCLSNV